VVWPQIKTILPILKGLKVGWRSPANIVTDKKNFDVQALLNAHVNQAVYIVLAVNLRTCVKDLLGCIFEKARFLKVKVPIITGSVVGSESGAFTDARKIRPPSCANQP